MDSTVIPELSLDDFPPWMSLNSKPREKTVLFHDNTEVYNSSREPQGSISREGALPNQRSLPLSLWRRFSQEVTSLLNKQFQSSRRPQEESGRMACSALWDFPPKALAENPKMH